MRLYVHHKYELLIYGLLWAAMFIAPLISIEFHHDTSEGYPWNELVSIWLQIANLLIVFLVHNFLLAPLLVYRQRRVAYFTCITVLVGCFIVLQCVNKPEPLRHGKPRHEFIDRQQQEHDEAFPWEEHEHNEGNGPWEEYGFQDMPPEQRPPLIFGQHDLISSIMLILLLGMNIGVKLYFKQRDDQMRMKELERQNLQQQLEYLRYQINPHFLMNTLNNIHALVDIDSERAKETIVELSKIMRFALYEGSHSTVPLGRDVAFLESYIHLMRLRYTDKVNITVDISQQLPDSNIPPMLFITFVENAFKHGISYQQTSFINISLQTKDHHLLFSCQNSKPQQPQKNEEGGVGLQNVQRRLQLLYGDNFTLTISNEPDTYNIRLVIPL